MSNQIFCNSNALLSLSLSLFSLFHFGSLAHLILSVWNVELKERNQEFDRSSLGLILCMLSFSKFYVYCARWMKTWRKPSTSRLAWLTCSGFFVWHLCRKKPWVQGTTVYIWTWKSAVSFRETACLYVCVWQESNKVCVSYTSLVMFSFFRGIWNGSSFSLSDGSSFFFYSFVCVCVCVCVCVRTRA